MADAEKYDRSCLRDLRTTDPREDKKRIEDSKGGLLEDSLRFGYVAMSEMAAVLVGSESSSVK